MAAPCGMSLMYMVGSINWGMMGVLIIRALLFQAYSTAKYCKLLNSKNGWLNDIWRLMGRSKC